MRFLVFFCHNKYKFYIDRIILFSLSSFLFLLSPALKADVELIFGIYASEKPSSLHRKFEPIMRYLETELNKNRDEKIKISIKVAKSYESGIEDIVEGHIDFSRLGPASYIEAKDLNPNLHVLALESKKGKKEFNGIICVLEDSSYTDVKQLKGKSFAFGDQLSTIGRYLSQQYLLKSGIKEKDLSEYQYLGRHDRVGIAVSNKAFDAGALKESTFNKLIKEGHPLRAIAKFKNVTKPWIASEKMPKKILAPLKAALLALKDKKILNILKKDGFLKADNEDFNLIEDAIKNNYLFFN